MSDSAAHFSVPDARMSDRPAHVTVMCARKKCDPTTCLVFLLANCIRFVLEFPIVRKCYWEKHVVRKQVLFKQCVQYMFLLILGNH